MHTNRYVIVNADDFGQSDGVTRGIIEAHERGIVTSTSMMVRWPAAPAAAAYARTHPSLAVGLHLDLSEWAYRNGEWVALYEVVPETDAVAVAHELDRQLAVFRDLMGRDPTHIDSHQHSHRNEPARSHVVAMARGLGVPLRHYSPDVRYLGDFYGQTTEGEPLLDYVSLDALRRLLAGLPDGVTELGCHPSAADDLDTMYLAERRAELRTLCDPAARAALAEFGVGLCSFADYPAARLSTNSI